MIVPKVPLTFADGEFQMSEQMIKFSGNSEKREIILLAKEMREGFKEEEIFESLIIWEGFLEEVWLELPTEKWKDTEKKKS